MSFIDFNKYEKDTVLINSDRVVINSKDDSVFLLSKKTIGLSACESVHFDIGPRGSKDTNYVFIVNSPYIQLGLPENGINEPIAKAESVISFINDLIFALNEFSDGLAKATALGVGVSKLPQVATSAVNLTMKLNAYKEKYGQDNSPIRSKISKTI